MKEGIANHNRRVLVTGAAGFLGRHLVPALLAEGWEVLALVHEHNLPECFKTKAVRVFQGDLNDHTTIRDCVSQADAICHVAAYIPPNYEDPAYAEVCLKTNGLATLQLAQFALERPGCRFVYLSAGNAYASANTVATETCALYPAERATYYLTSKVVGEIFVEHLRRVHQLHAVCLRVSSPYGWGMPEKSVVSRFMNCARQGRPLQVWDGGIPAYDFVYVSDVIRLAVAALHSGPPGIYNVGSGRAHSVLKLAQAVVDTFPEREVPIEVRPPLGSIPASFPALSIEKAIRTWNYHPLSLREGLAEYRRQMELESSDCSDTE